MTPDEIHDLHHRFDRLEEKLDEYAKQTIQVKQDVYWLKGSIKVGLSALTALGAALVGSLIHILTGK